MKLITMARQCYLTPAHGHAIVLSPNRQQFSNTAPSLANSRIRYSPIILADHQFKNLILCLIAFRSGTSIFSDLTHILSVQSLCFDELLVMRSPAVCTHCERTFRWCHEQRYLSDLTRLERLCTRHISCTGACCKPRFKACSSRWLVTRYGWCF